jgi:MFS transporter, SP family, arabinose:H+ symporter
MEKTKINLPYILAISIASAFGGLLFGYDWVVIGGAKPFYEPFFQITNSPYLQGWAMGSALIGCLAGAWLSGLLSDAYGRKKLLLLAAALFVVASIGTGAANNFTFFIVYRILGGIGIGLASNLSPMYIAEVSPSKVRGKFVSLNQLTIVIGILAAQLINWQIAQPVPSGATSADILASWNGQEGWRWMFWVCSIPAILFFVFVLFIPESPRWLVAKGRSDKAFKIMKRITGEEVAQSELAEIKKAINTDESGISFFSLFKNGAGRIMLLGIVLAVFQQWCGINVIFNYAQEVFSSAGYSVNDILFNIVITGSVNLVFTFVAIFTVDKLGRKFLMLLGAGGLAGIYAVMGTLYYFHFQGWPLLVLVILAIACYSMSLAPVTWVVLSEIFPNKIRGAAMSVATIGLWAACFILTYTFPLLNNAFGASGTFWLYGIICISGFVFIFKKLPETKGKSLEEIEQQLLNKN